MSDSGRFTFLLLAVAAIFIVAAIILNNGCVYVKPLTPDKVIEIVTVTDTIYIAPYHAYDFAQSHMKAAPGKVLGYQIVDSTHVILLLENWEGIWVQIHYKWNTQWNCWNLEE